VPALLHGGAAAAAAGTAFIRNLMIRNELLLINNYLDYT